MVITMRNIVLTIILLASLPAHAAKPVKITPAGEGSLNGEEYRKYTVLCNNGDDHPITAWGSGKRWCVGEASQENCAKKQIKTAKEACKM